MSEPIRDSNSRPEAYDGNTYSASEGGSFSGSPRGTGYTTPTGGYGYAYSPEPEPGNSGHGRRVFLIVSIAVMTILLCGCILLGALLVRSSLPASQPGESETDRLTDTGDAERGTQSGGFIVIDPSDTGTEAVSATEPQVETIAPETVADETAAPVETPTASPMSETDTEPAETLPSAATVIKKSASRKDTDGDGKADIELDENGNVITSAGDSILPAATVVYRVADSVVEITTETISRSSRMGQYVTSGAGSGVIISEEGFIVTNNHVIDGADTITVRLTDGTTYAATLIGTDEQTDVALLWIDKGDKRLTVATMGSSFDLVVGENILAIGNPLGSLGGTVTEGIISATARSIEVDGTAMTLLQISSPISPGNSGGGLFNMAGELIGIVNAKMSETDVEGLGFAIPIDTAYEIVNELYSYGYVRGRPTVGVTMVDVTSSWTALQYFRSQYTGVYVYDNSTEGPLAFGDLIVSVAGVKVSSVSELNSVIGNYKVGDELEFVVYRDGQTTAVTVPLIEYVPEGKTPAA